MVLYCYYYLIKFYLCVRKNYLYDSGVGEHIMS